MSRRPQICFTFVGTVSRDSRLRRFARAAAAIADVSVLTLTDEPAATLHGVAIVSIPRGPSLRSALPRFWRMGADALPAGGADALPAGGADALPAGGADLYIAADLYSLPLAARLAAAGSSGLIYDSRELYRAIAALEGRRLMQGFWSALERRYARRAHAVLTVNDSIAEILRAEFDDVRVLHNYPDAVEDRASNGSNRLREALGIPADQRILLSQGGLQRGRGALLCVNALAQVDAAALVFLGDGPLRDEILLHARVHGVEDRVHVHPAVPSDELLSWTAGADVGLCMIENLGRSYYLSLPNKLFEYMAAGLPVVGSDFPEIGRVLRASGAGIPVPADNPDALAESLRQLLADSARLEELRQRSVDARTAYQWQSEETLFRSLLEEQLRKTAD
ncbi:MAG: glycosyltransferase [Bacteroidota bacterium]|nr:glycosyltransferase [Bacteroidota bacterium]